MMLAHDVERRPEFGDWFCDCHGCGIQARALAHHDPHAPIVLKFGAAPRMILSAARWAALVLEHGPNAADVAVCPAGDYVREVFVGSPELAATMRAGR